MALKPCRECKKEVSTGAKQCPQCGVANPTSRPGAGSVVGLLFAVGLLLWFFSSINTTSTTTSPPADPSASLRDAAANDSVARCRADWRQCDSNAQIVNNWRGWSLVQVRCKSASNTSAKYGEPKWPWFAFGSFYQGKSYLTGKATVIEPDAQIQNGFGASEHVRVTCLYDLNSEAVLDVTTLPH